MVIIEEKGVQVKKERKDRKGSGFDSLLKKADVYYLSPEESKLKNKIKIVREDKATWV